MKNDIAFHLFGKIFSGPLTHTDYRTGVTTIYGVVSALGDTDRCLDTTLYARVAVPSVLDWIRRHTDAT